MRNFTFCRRSMELGLVLICLAGCKSGTDQSSKPTSAPQPTSASTQAARPRTPNDILERASAKPSAPFDGEGWRPMFDGKTLAGWRETAFAGHGDVQCESGLIVLNMGDPFTGISWTNEVRKIDYEVALDAMRV